jgi:archaellum component FlaC
MAEYDIPNRVNKLERTSDRISDTLQSIDNTLKKFETHITDFQDFKTSHYVTKEQVRVIQLDVLDLKNQVKTLQIKESSSSTTMTMNEKIIWLFVTLGAGYLLYLVKGA